MKLFRYVFLSFCPLRWFLNQLSNRTCFKSEYDIDHTANVFIASEEIVSATHLRTYHTACK